MKSNKNYNSTYLPFEEALDFVHSLKIKSLKDWERYCKSGRKPSDIPASPDRIYKNEWTGWNDWLESSGASPKAKWRSFDKARKFIHSLHLKNQHEWYKYSRSGKKPSDIPVTPFKVYKDFGWISWGDWLGTGFIANSERVYRPFKKARAFARSLNFKKKDEWNEFCDSGKKPDDIPKTPYQTYKNDEWISWGDWLGTGFIATYKRIQMPFKEARAFVRKQNLKNVDEWIAFTRSGKKTQNIPNFPAKAYAKLGWIGYGDWLGTGRIADQNKVFLPFKKARAFARSLKLQTGKEWLRYCKSGKRPKDIPANPRGTYEKEWMGWGDWLGTGTIAKFERVYRPYKKARAFTRSLNLKSANEWREYSKSGKKPNDIPAAPERTYENKGWTNWGDWLGN